MRSGSSSGIHSLIACHGGSTGSMVSMSKGGGGGFNSSEHLNAPTAKASGRLAGNSWSLISRSLVTFSDR